MPDLLSPTNPVPGHDKNIINRNMPLSPNDTRVQNVPDPTRVIRPDGRTDRQDNSDQSQSSMLRFDSNYQTFFERLRSTPGALESLTKLLLARQGVVSSGIGEGLATELSQIMEMLRVDADGLEKLLLSQLQSGTRFDGPLFSILRGAYNGSQSEPLHEDILQFLKKYIDFSSTKHLEGNILREVGGMMRSIPASWGTKLAEIAAKLENGIAAGDREGNLRLLQGELFPLMSDYVDTTRDLGRARTLLRMLALNIARYENGSEQSVIQAFHRLLGYNVLKDKLAGLDDGMLLRTLRDTTFTKASQNNSFADHLANAAAHALRGAGGADAQNAFREIVSAMLINESVYMPINHFLLPLEWDGKMAFSELWVDPNDGGGENGEESTPGVRMLFKMDIQEIGMFDVALVCRAGTVDMTVGCPERVAPFAPIVQGELTRILKESGLKAAHVFVEKLEKPLTISEVFPKILEGRNSVNVKV